MSKPLIPLATNGEIFPWRDIRLPQFIKPIHYNITIHPNLTTLEVKGQVAIKFIVTEDTKFIVLHSHNLTITEQMIEYDNDNTLKISRILEFVTGKQIYIETSEMFQRDHNYILNIRYSSNLSRDFTGFYISNYVDDSGEKRYLAATYFQPTYARMAFPCFDEPHLKAKFKMSIFRDRFHISLFNTPVKKTEDVGFYMGTGLLRDDFEETLEMSTYLVAFVICDYVRLTKKTKTGISVSVYTPKSFIKYGDTALEIATFMMDFFESFFEIPYPFSKQDLIAIPEFTNTAMENWGLITYRDTAILYNPIESSTANLQWITTIIAHEIAHQWFGNLVTMKWWNDVWLNEGFASFLEYMAVDFMKPDWKMMDQFIIDQIQPALTLDALSSTHSISVDNIYNSNQIISIFDIISYKKGAAILQMLSNFLPNDVLHTGMKYFLTKYQYKNAQTDDFWNSLNEHVNQSLDIKQIMDVWTKKMGYPLIRIKKDGHLITATQERFLLQIAEQEIYEPEVLKTNVINKTNSTNIDEDDEIKYKWFVPLTYRTNENQSNEVIWMNLTDVVFNISSTAKWIKANVNQSGFYRVLYTDQMWYELIKALKNDVNVLSPADRANLIDDAFVLNRAGLLNINITLELSLYLKNEFEYAPWNTALGHLNHWSKSLYESSTYQVFLKYLKNILNPIVDSLNWNSTNSTHIKKLLRSQILSAMVLIAESEKDINVAKNRFHDWMTQNVSIDADLKEIIYSAGIKYGENIEWNYCWRIFLKTRNPSERQLLLKALGSASDLWLLQRLLLRTLDKEKIKQQDIRLVLTSVAENPTGRLLAWRFLKAHWLQLYSILNNNTLLMGSLTTSITAHLSTPFDYKEVSTYFSGIRMPAASHLLQQSLETIKLNANWLLKNDQGLYDWIKDNLLKQ